jgi:aspartyl protease family protein
VSEFPRGLKLTTIWLLIGTAVFLGVRAFEQQQARTRIEVSGRTIELRRAPDGHYHWPGAINGRKVDFLIDTGATTTTLPQSLADALELPALGRVHGTTANGPVSGTLTRADVTLEGGVAVSNLRLIALPALQAPLLGMNVLGRLQWRQSGDRLIIDAGATPSGAFD